MTSDVMRTTFQCKLKHIKLLCVCTYRMVGVANSTYQQALARGLTQAQAWNVSTVDWTVAAKVQ